MASEFFSLQAQPGHRLPYTLWFFINDWAEYVSMAEWAQQNLDLYQMHVGSLLSGISVATEADAMLFQMTFS